MIIGNIRYFFLIFLKKYKMIQNDYELTYYYQFNSISHFDISNLIKFKNTILMDMI